jgi:hypothetical protein
MLQITNPKDCSTLTSSEEVGSKVHIMQHSCFQIVQNLQQITVCIEPGGARRSPPSLGFALVPAALSVIHSNPLLQGHPVPTDVQSNEKKQRRKTQLLKDTIQKMQEEKEDETK